MVENRTSPAGTAPANAEPVEMLLNMGPQHPSTHGVFRMVLWVDGEKIVDVEPHIGYLHRGSEKLCEGEQYHQVITLFDRLDYVSNFNNELVYCQAVEKLMDLKVPERAEYVRVILCELNRIASHLLYVGTIGLDAGAMTPTMFAFRGRERIQALFEAVSGARMMHNFFRIGGIKEELPDNFEQLIGELLPVLREDVEESDRILTFNEIFLSRLKDVGAISPEEAVDFGFTGPCLRGCGVEYDVRRAQPYSIYDRFDFEVPVGLDGDCWDRHWVRVQEMYESLKIVEQALDQMPGGDVMSSLGRRLIRPAAGEVYVRAENPRGEIGVHLISNGTDRPYRLKIRPPSFCNLSAIKRLLMDSWIADSVVILGSLDIVLGGGGPVTSFALPLLNVTILQAVWMVVALLLMFTGLSVVVLSMVWLERKSLGRLQLRLGPTRTGPMGLMQPIADAVKLILKEDIIPTSSDRAIFWAAPVIVVLSAFMIWVTIPAAEGLALRNLELGLFYITAVAVVGILGLVLAGWGSANKYGVLGGCGPPPN